MYKHESGHTMQSRLLGSLYLSKIAIPSLTSDQLKMDHDNCWYEVWSNKIGGAEETDNYPKKFRHSNFWYWSKIIVSPFYPN